MDHYSKKKSAILKIDKMIIEGKTDAEIEYYIGQVFGFGSKIVKERREIIEKLREEAKNKDVS